MVDTEPLRWPTRTKEYVHAAVTANVDPLPDDVAVAIVEHGTHPADADYQPAEWTPGQTWTAGAALDVRYLIGKNTLTAGMKYDLWVQVVDAPEVPEILAGQIKAV